jgi:PAS domain-containing protein
MEQPVLNLISLMLNLLLGGGLVAVWLKYRVQVRGEDRTDFDAIIAVLTQQRADDRALISEQDRRIENLEAEINGLRIARDLDPFPNWIVDLQGEYRFVNREFESYFLEPRRQTYRDVIGKSRDDIWPEDFCRTLQNLDAVAKRRPDGTARATTQLDVPNIGRCTVTVHKFPVRFKGAIVAMAGYMTTIEPEDERIGM